MNSVDLAFTPAIEQAQLIRNKAISPLELTQLYLDRIERLNPKLGTYFTVIAEQAIADAKAKTEQIAQCDDPTKLPPFFGVPISIKDLNSVNGVRCTYGSYALKDNVATYDDSTVTRCKYAGFTILGKTATSEMGSWPYSEPPGFPAARNPWNPDYTPGGSSGGAAASVAAGLSPIAQGSDGGGSIRGPASCCGVVGIKPARGRVSYAPIGDVLNGIATIGPIGRTVADAAALLDVISGYVTGDPYWLPDPDPSFVQTALMGAKQGVGRSLRIAYGTRVEPLGEAHPDCVDAVIRVAKILESLGHTVEQHCPQYPDLLEPFQVVWRTGLSACGLPPEAFSPKNRWLLEHADTSGIYQQAVWKIQGLGRRVVAFFDHYDVLVMPIFMHPTIRVGEWEEMTPEEHMEKVISWIAPCPIVNTTGQPAIAIPAGFDSRGLPIGVQLIGKPADEATLIALAAHIEATHPWAQNRPAIAVEE
ncbi:MAG: amidase [Synechococcales cyanobacterium T60_A2020_003]|nr:amidase [Synechococcales cyanobacterium T60_A2020_003]